MKRSLIGKCFLVFAAGSLGCGGGGGDGTPTGPGTPSFTGTTITLTADRFSPNDVTVDPGTAVRWVSSTSTAHTITPDNPQQPGVWTRTTTSGTGTVLTHTFNVAGQTYTYICELHVGMSGTIRVP